MPSKSTNANQSACKYALFKVGQRNKSLHTHKHTQTDTLYLRELTTSTPWLWGASEGHQLMLTEWKVEGLVRRTMKMEIKKTDGKLYSVTEMKTEEVVKRTEFHRCLKTVMMF